MSRPVLFAFILIGIVSFAFSACAAGDVTFYVSPSGNDSWSGKTAGKSASDGPFATLERAQKAVREAKASGNAAGPVIVFLRGGVYELAEPLVFTSDDSGTERNPVTWTAYPGEKPVVSAGDGSRDSRRAGTASGRSPFPT